MSKVNLFLIRSKKKNQNLNLNIVQGQNKHELSEKRSGEPPKWEV